LVAASLPSGRTSSRRSTTGNVTTIGFDMSANAATHALAQCAPIIRFSAAKGRQARE
jgi:hypothetical protein